MVRPGRLRSPLATPDPTSTQYAIRVERNNPSYNLRKGMDDSQGRGYRLWRDSWEFPKTRTLMCVGMSLPDRTQPMGLLVISEHTEETLSLKEWEEKLLVVRDGTEGQGPVCAFLGHSGPGHRGLGQQMWDRCMCASQGLITQLHLVV